MLAGRFKLMRTFRARFLLALVLIGILPLGAIGLGIALLDSRAISEQSAKELKGLARGLAGQLDVHLNGFLEDTRAIASLPGIVNMDRAQQGNLLKELFHHYSKFARLSTFDLPGQRLSSSHPGGAPSIALRKSFQTAVQLGHQSWEVAHALSTGRSSLLIHTPIRDSDRRVIGAVGALVDLENLSAVVGRVHVGDGGQAFVLDSAGRVLLHPDRAIVQERPDYSWLGVATGRPLAGSGTVRYESESEARIAGYAAVSNAGWTVVVERPETDILMPAKRSWRLALTGLAISVVLALVTAAFFAHKLTRPVSELAAAARALGAGNMSVPLPIVGPEEGEMRTLIKAFGEMRGAVETREKALRENEDRFRSLIESAPDAIVVVDINGSILIVNRQAEKMFGYIRDELLGTLVETLLPERFREAHAQHLKNYYSEPRSRPMGTGLDLYGQRKDGSEFPVDISLSPTQTDEGLLVTSIIRDITERKRAEEALHQKTVELETANRVKDEFLSVMSHELRTPLNVVMGYTGMMKDRMFGEISQEQEKALGKVLSRSNDLLSMVSAIMQATSIEAGEVKAVIHEISLGNFLDELRPRYELPLDKELALNWDYPSELPAIKTDSEKLKQILQNLVNNAIKFTEKGNVTISARHIPEAKAVEFKVADTGIGIPKEALPAIFEKFRQVDSSETRLYGGVGIGLYIVKKFTELLGGKVEAQSEPGKGSTFTVTIPSNH